MYCLQYFAVYIINTAFWSVRGNLRGRRTGVWSVGPKCWFSSLVFLLSRATTCILALYLLSTN